MFTRKFSIVSAILFSVIALCSSVYAAEVNKGGIPTEHLNKSCKALPWGVVVWDVPEVIPALKAKEEILWVDTRPESFFQKGTVRGAVLLPYNKTGENGNVMTKETLDAAIKSGGFSRDSVKLVFFCQGPKCHRSYNAAYVAVTQWDFDAKNVIWFRDGYPILFDEVKSNPKLKRKAKRYISDSGMSNL
jgi:rhodanese-related sulfurtransferase